MSKVKDITITAIDAIHAFSLSKKYLFTIDELQNATIAQTQEKGDITGKGGRKISSLKKNKAVTISGTNGFISGGLLEMQTGSLFENKDTEVMWRETLTVNTQSANTTWKAVGTPGAEISNLYLMNEDKSLGEELTQNATAESSGQFAYAPTTKALTFYEDVEDGTEVMVCYKRKVNGEVHENFSDKYSEKCSLYIDAVGEDSCGDIYRIQVYIPKADFSGEFSLEMGDNQTVHAFEAESLAGACGTSGSLWTYTVIGANEEDAT